MDGIPVLRIAVVDFDDSYTRNLVTVFARLWDSQKCQTATDQLVRENLAVLPHTTPLLASESGVRNLLSSVDALVLSPGPGSPHLESDFGAGQRLLACLMEQASESQVPVLGVCLGHQGLAAAFGATIRPAHFVRHGVRSRLYWNRPELPSTPTLSAQSGVTTPSTINTTPASTPPPREMGIGLFAGLGQGIEVVRYNSLTVDPDSLSSIPELEVIAWGLDVLQPDLAQPPPTKPNKDSLPVLASELEFAFKGFPIQNGSDKLSKAEPEAVVLALRHTSRPLWGVQFHPESIDSEGGEVLLANFLRLAGVYRRRSRMESGMQFIAPPLSMDILEAAGAALGPSDLLSLPSPNAECEASIGCQSLVLPTPAASATHVLSALNALEKFVSGFEPIWLDSAASVGGGLEDQWSYMAIPRCWLVYRRSHPSQNGRGVVTVHLGAAMADFALNEGEDWWSVVDSLQREVCQGLPTLEEGSSPFTGGFIGYFGYGMRYESILAPRYGDGQPGLTGSNNPDSELALCLRLVAHDHKTNQWRAYVHNIPRPHKAGPGTAARILQYALTSVSDSQEWLQSVDEKFAELHAAPELSSTIRGASDAPSAGSNDERALPPLVPEDSASAYAAKVQACRALIGAGESYELCLTTRLCGRLNPEPIKGEERDAHWSVYQRLRSRNPAPYGAYVPLPRLGSTVRTIACSSPERFLSVSPRGRVVMKPIKGTVPRAGYGIGEERYRDLGTDSPDQRDEKGVWRAKADQLRVEQLSRDRKERAENLMIVDLIRADLEAHCVAGSVEVPSLMQVESYARVHQLVTTVTGQLPAVPTASKGSDASSQHTGVGATLRQAFPPGSMTGAPKRRSVQLLEQLEAAGRHSFPAAEERGVYAGILGWIDFRGAADFNVIIRTAMLSGSDVSLGAGGAITYASDPGREWDELLHKARSVAPILLEGEETE